VKLAFINSPGIRYIFRGTICTYISKARYVWKPKDFILLSSTIPPDWDIVFLDASINDISPDETLKWSEDQNPDVFVVALSSIVWHSDFSFLERLRKKFPKVKIFVFGEVFLETSLAQQARQYADGIIYDPLRSNLPEMIAKGVESDYPHLTNGRLKETKDIKTYIPRHDLFDNTKYRWPFIKHFRFASIYTQFGCPFTCSYCSESITNVTYRVAEDVLDEMRFVKSKGYKEVLIGDSSFGYPRENALKILNGMVRENFGFSWSAYIYPGLADEKTVELMAKSGCHTAVIGIDSADGSLLEKYGRKLPLLKIADFIDNCHKNKIEVCGDIILGFKEDTIESCMKTIQLTIDLRIDYTSVNIATPLMGTAIREEYKALGRIRQGETGFDTAGLSGVVDLDKLTAKDLIKMRNHAVKRFYMRPSYIWKQICKTSSIEELRIKIDEAMGIFINLFK